jgi:hypothetical protein
MELSPTSALSVHLTLPLTAFIVSVAANVPHYIWFKQTYGTSDSFDRGGAVVFA